MTPEARKRKDAHLRKTYGITIEEYEALLKFQGGKCGCGCGRPFEEGKLWSVDHNHLPPFEVRGIVAYACNRYKIGALTAEEAYRLYQYLTMPPATQFFGEPRRVPAGMEKGQKKTRKKRTTRKRDIRGRGKT